LARNYNRREEVVEPLDINAWQPKTKVGEMVKLGQITSIDQIFAMGKPIKEVEIVDVLIPAIQNKVLEIASVQRMTKNNRKQKFRATVVVGDMNGHMGVGTGKDVEVKPAIESAIRDAKKKIIPVRFGCGSWECNCGTSHTLPLTVRGKCGSVQVILKPAPRGVGIVANKVIKSVLQLTGASDAWSFSRGRTRDIYNMAVASYNALSSMNKLRNTEEVK
jgi:small subunit ribosomal protein S5